MKKYIQPFLMGCLVFCITYVGLVSSYFIYKTLFKTTIKPTNNFEYASTSVMITKYDGRSGGTGVIISSSRNMSKVLTNAHVCSLLSSGGIVRSDRAKGVVTSYKVSDMHDLCLITTNTNFHINTVLADKASEPYDDAIISGHPHLLPNIVTHGHFSQKEIVEILTGFKPCTEEDRASKETFEYCLVLNKIPIIKSFEAQVVSATIMPGSSGSAVFNTDGELSGLVFAGSGEFGYAMIVPYEYIYTFFNNELPSLKAQIPNKKESFSMKDKSINWKSVCSKRKSSKIQKLCTTVSKNLLLNN